MHAERDAGDEDVEAAQAAAQFAQGKAQRQPKRPRRRERLGGNGHEALQVGDSRSRCGPSAAARRDRSARQRGVVGHQHQRHAALGMLGEQEIDDLLAGGLVEIAGRFVRHQDSRIGRQRAGQRDALLLAAGQLRGIMMQPIAEADGRSSSRARRGIGMPASSSGTATFSSAVMVGIR